ncbi:MAG TPA: FtsX-like permease family protein [Casimicrobiaceae bacterium]
MAIACGVGALILGNGFIDWNLRFGRESTIYSQLGHIRVFKRGYLESGLANPFAYILPDDPRQIGIIESEPHVRALAPRLSVNGLISHGDATLSFLGEGVAPDKEPLLSQSVTTTQGEALSPADPDGIVLGQGLAANLGVKPGDTVVLVANTVNGGVNAVEARVRGLFATITKAYDDSALRLPIAMARQLLRLNGAHSYALILDQTDSTDAVLSRLRERFRGQPLEFVPWYQLADFYNKTAKLFSRQVAVLRVIVGVIIVLSISNSMMMSVLERTSEIGTSMALGTRRSAILRLFLTEGVLLGLFGGVLGLIGGYLLAQVITVVGIPMPPPPGMAFGYTAGINVSWPPALEAWALAIATALIASLYPAWKASRMTIVEAIRRNP